MNLSEAERERLAMLMEEAGEVVQVIGKILRHGYESYHPNDPGTSNRQLLDKEMRDLIAVHCLMIGEDDVPAFPLHEVVPTMIQKLKWTHHQGDTGFAKSI